MAKIIDDSIKSNYHKTYKGTPKFIAPQLLKNERYTDKSDIWSLGITFYYMVYNAYPWNDPNPMTLLNTIEKTINSNKLFPANSPVS